MTRLTDAQALRLASDAGLLAGPEGPRGPLVREGMSTTTTAGKKRYVTTLREGDFADEESALAAALEDLLGVVVAGPPGLAGPFLARVREAGPAGARLRVGRRCSAFAWVDEGGGVCVAPGSSRLGAAGPGTVRVSEAPGAGARVTDSELVSAIREELWPAGDPGSEWDDETVERVATLLRRAGRGPDGEAELLRADACLHAERHGL